MWVYVVLADKCPIDDKMKGLNSSVLALQNPLHSQISKLCITPNAQRDVACNM